MNKVTMDKLEALCKNRGFVFAGSEIYGGLANSWDYGPLGVELKNNIRDAWWQRFVRENTNVEGLDSSIILNTNVWEASGHIGGFADPLLDCKQCKTRHRADHLLEGFIEKKSKGKDKAEYDGLTLALVTTLKPKEMSAYIKKHTIVCPNCGKSDFTDIRQFNLMFKTFQGVTEESANVVYLRPETAQGIFINFKNVARTSRNKIPFGVAQVGKAFRNEITPGKFIFRTREFEQMEMQFFCKPGTDEEWFTYWADLCYKFLLDLGIEKNNLRKREHEKEELSHYSKRTQDIEFLFPFGFGEIWGIANRTDFDLKAHMTKSGENLEYLDPVTNERYIPYVIEPSVGLGRLVLSFLTNGYVEEELVSEKGEKDTRVVLKLHPALAPYKVCILPLQKQLNEKAGEIYKTLSKHFSVTTDESGSIGKRYRRQDEIGTPFCITVDFDTLEDKKVTVRDRDTMKQERIAITKLIDYIAKRVEF